MTRPVDRDPTASLGPDAVSPAASEMLTPSEIESLRQDLRESSAYAQKAFAHLRPKES